MSNALLATMLASMTGAATPGGADSQRLVQAAVRAQFAQSTTVAPPGTTTPAAQGSSVPSPLIDPTKPQLPPREVISPGTVKPYLPGPRKGYVTYQIGSGGSNSQSTGWTPPLVGVGADSTGQSVSRPDSVVGGFQYGPPVRPDAAIGGLRYGMGVRPDMGIGAARPFASSKGMSGVVGSAPKILRPLPAVG